MKAVSDALGLLWASRIKAYSVDLLNRSMLFELETVDFGNAQNHTLEICQIRAFSFFNNTKESIDRIWIPEPNDYLELTSISFMKGTEQVIKSIDEKWAERYGSTFNLCMEVWSSMIFINAAFIKIDGTSYSI